MKVTETTKVDVTAFELKLPAPFDVQPDYSVDLPAKHKALIYNTTGEVRDPSKPLDTRGTHAVKEVPAWRMVVVNKAGHPTSKDTYGTQTDHVYTSALSVQYMLKKWVSFLSKTKRTNVREDDPDSE